MKFKKQLFRMVITGLALCIASFVETLAQVAPAAGKIRKVLKDIYDNPAPTKFTLDAYKFDGHGKKVVIFGTNHAIRNPADSMYTSIDREFAMMSPNIVLIEAITSYLHPTRENNIEMGGDSGYLRYLAYKKGIEAYIWDLDMGEIYNVLRKEFSREDLTLFFYCLKLRYLALPMNANLDRVISSKAKELSIVGVPLSEKEWNPAYFKSIFKSRFQFEYSEDLSEKDWSVVNKYFDTGPLSELESKLFQFRDQRLLRVIGNFAKENDRIFIQAGAMHKEVMKRVLPIYMKDFTDVRTEKETRKIRDLKEEALDWEPYHRKITVGNKELLLWSSSARDISEDDELSQELLRFKPSAILLEDFPEHYASKQENIKLAGEPGLIRYLGANNDFPVYNWANQVSRSLYSLLPKYKREDVCAAITFHYLLKYQQMYSNFENYDFFWSALSARLLCANAMFTYYEASIGRFSEHALNYGIVSETASNKVAIDFDKLRTALKSPALLSINYDLELLKANELLSSVAKSLQTNQRIFVHAPYKYIKSLENSLPAIVNNLKQ